MSKKPAANNQAAVDPNAYYDFVYVSRATISGDIAAELARIQACAKAVNQQHGIRGALIYQAGYFLQRLQGPKAALEKLILKLEKDSRHSSSQTLLFEPQRAPLATDWSMGTAVRDESEQALDARVQSIIQGVKTESWSANDIVRRFVKPGSANNASAQNERATVARVSVLGSNAVWPSALIRHIAKAEKLPAVEQTRFSSLDAPLDESVCEYIDLAPSPGTILRISSITGWMAQSPLFDLLRSDDQIVVVMFKSANTAATLEYAATILSAYQQRTSLIVGVFSPRATLQADVFLDYAKREGFEAQVVIAPLAEPGEIWDAVRQVSRGVLKTMLAPPPPPPITTAEARPAPKPQLPPLKNAAENVLAKPPIAAGPNLSPPDAQLQTALAALLSGETAVKEWAAWAESDLTYLAGTNLREAPAQNLHALAALQSKLDAKAPIECLSMSSQGRFEWAALLPWQTNSIWLHVVLSDSHVHFGMAQFLTTQWKNMLAQYQASQK